MKTIVATFALALLAAPALAQDRPTQQPQQPQQQGQAQQITLDDIEENAERYAGRTVTVTGEVDDILGPRLFTVDDDTWIDFDGEAVVVTPAPLAALVTQGSQIVITGTVRPLVEAEFEKESGWFGNDPKIEAEIKQRSGIVAQKVTMLRDGGEVALTIDMTKPATAQQGQQVTDLNELAKTTDTEMVGRPVDVQNARVEAMADQGGGFWVNAGEERLFVMPDAPGQARVQPGQTVRLQGYVLTLPDNLKEQLGDQAKGEEIYVYARQVAPAGT